MRPVIHEVVTAHTPESLLRAIGPAPGCVLLRSGFFEAGSARYSLLAVDPFLTFQSRGSRCEFLGRDETRVQFGNPWALLEEELARHEVLDHVDLPFPVGGAFGFWGYDLKNFVEPRLRATCVRDLELPDSWVAFHSSLVVFDHALGKTWVVAAGLAPDGSRDPGRASAEVEAWQARLALPPVETPGRRCAAGPVGSSMTRAGFIAAVERLREWIRAGDIYQANLSHRLEASLEGGGWEFFEHLSSRSPAPFAAYLHGGGFEIASSSPEQFLQISGAQVRTRPIKGTRPRSADPTRDAQLGYELQTSGKERSELLMITDLLRNDLGRICEYGSVRVPELMRLERYPHVQHLVSTVEGTLRGGITHFGALARCFPGGSITGAPKVRAMEIIDLLEPVSRGPYTGCIGYVGFNRESQLSIAIRTAVIQEGKVYFHVGAGIVADSDAAAEYEETLAKAAGFLAVVQQAACGERKEENR